MEARNRQLPEWFNRIKTGQIKLPRFQRFEAWSHSEVSDLLETVLHGLPCGAVLILEVGDEERFISREMEGAPEPVERVTEHLLDGQQRLTALWRSLHDNYEDRTYFVSLDVEEDEDGAKVPRVFGQARWKKNGKDFPLWADEPDKVFERKYIPLKLLRPGDIGDEIERWCDLAVGEDPKTSRQLERLIVSRREKFTNFNIPFLSLPAPTPKPVALNVFIKMNTSSVQLSPYDIVVAEVEAASGESLHDLIAELKQKVPSIESYVEASNLALSIAAMREDRPPTQASFHRLDLPRMVDEWDRVTAGVEWAVSFLEEERIFDGSRLPTVVVLPVLGAIHENIPEALDGLGNAKTLLRKYLWRAFLTERYDNSAGTRSLQDLRGLRGILGGQQSETAAPILDEKLFPLPAVEELDRAGWPKKKEILARGILAVSIKRGAHDIADGTVAARSNLLHREYHHLFPDSLLKNDAGLPRSRRYTALNCALVTWNTNRNISNKEPLSYLQERVLCSSLGESEIRARLASHLVPYDVLAVGGYSDIANDDDRSAKITTDYERFLHERAELMLEAIGQLCSGRRWPEG